MGQLFDELKRRNVFRVAVAYLVAAREGRANDERAKLGMAPYQPIAITQ